MRGGGPEPPAPALPYWPTAATLCILGVKLQLAFGLHANRWMIRTLSVLFSAGFVIRNITFFFSLSFLSPFSLRSNPWKK